jgi:hypothetical protein
MGQRLERRSRGFEPEGVFAEREECHPPDPANSRRLRPFQGNSTLTHHS